MIDIIVLVVSVLLVGAGLVLRRSASAKLINIATPTKKDKRGKKYATWMTVAGGYLLITRLIVMIFGPGKSEGGGVSIEITPPVSKLVLFGVPIGSSVITAWVIIAVIVVIALILRLTVVPKMKDIPKGSQNVLELATETAFKYSKSVAPHGAGMLASSWIFTVVTFLIGCACAELFGVRTPASDISVTAALGICSFIFINIYGFKVKGFTGRLKSMASPTPLVFPIRIVTDIAVPVSLACRLFGNMLGGLIVMDMLYGVLGTYAVGIPSVLGLFFNVFHPLIQAYIFITLTLNFINEATE
jgi:F-type H+-transporting ATPase subunit a